MKNIAIIFALAIQFIAAHAYGQRTFTSAALVTKHHDRLISFTLPSEANVTDYRIEAANDTTGFQIIGKVRSTGNSVLAKTYNYTLYQSDYKYYRVCLVAMNGNMIYSPIITDQPALLQPKLNTTNVNPPLASR